MWRSTSELQAMGRGCARIGIRIQTSEDTALGH
jgi:hypothetical protein